VGVVGVVDVVDVVGVGVGNDGAVTVKVTVTWTAAPSAGVIVTVVEYSPAGKPVASAVNVIVVDAPAASLSLVGSICSQEASDGVVAVHVNVPPPVLVTVIERGLVLSPAVALKDTPSALTCIEGEGCVTSMTTGIVTGLPVTASPVIESKASTVTLVLYVPLATPVASMTTFTLAFPPGARRLPDLAKSFTKLGASGARVALQFKGTPPVFEMVNDRFVTPAVTLAVSESGPTEKAGVVNTLSVTSTVCGLPAMVIPLFTAESEIEPLYVAAGSEAGVAAIVKVTLPPPIVAIAGETFNQPSPDARVTVGVMVTSPSQAPMTLTVKVCVDRFDPASALKISFAEDGACSVHDGCTVSITGISCEPPTGW
jgi:hypothetical protein